MTVSGDRFWRRWNCNEAITVSPNLGWLMSLYEEEIWTQREIPKTHGDREKTTWGPQVEERGLRRNPNCQHPDRGLPASMTVRKEIYCVCQAVCGIPLWQLLKQTQRVSKHRLPSSGFNFQMITPAAVKKGPWWGRVEARRPAKKLLQWPR